MRESILILLLVLLIVLFVFLRKRGEKKESERLETERLDRERRRKEGLKALSEEEKSLIYSLSMKERTAFIKNAEKDYDILFHPFNDLVYEKESGNKQIETKSLGYYVIEKGVDRIAAFFFSTDPDFESISAITLNINGMVSRRFEGFESYMKPMYFEAKSGDLITLEIEFDGTKNFTLNNFGVLLLKRRLPKQPS